MRVPGQSFVAEFRSGNVRYRPLVRIAAGGMAEVFRGEACFEDGRVEPVAIKRALPMLAQVSQFRSMFEDEARIGMLLRHPNIVRVFDAREVSGHFIMIMELVDGMSLRELWGSLKSRGQSLAVPAALHIGRSVASALGYAHEAIDEFGRELRLVHRDVSPHNVLLSHAAEVKLMDFGLANSSANLAERDGGMLGGKLGYLSPELLSEQRATPLLDLFALGVMLWECVTGTRLFQGSDDDQTLARVARCEVPNASSLNPAVNGDVDVFLAGLLSRDPEQRYQTAREVLVDLACLLEDHGGPRFARDDLARVLSEASVDETPP